MSGSDDIAIIGMAQTPAYERYDNTEPTLLMTVVNQLLEGAGLDRSDVDFTIAGSCDYLSGMPFAFVANVDGVGAWPPVYESHVEMDGAWALFEAWLRLQ
ncbi:MAG: lipid-transfer protein, partial [Acidimicrobiia bacterium]|nr:lipid-transfer protein [Acidimicrobiia bacterium]